MEVIRFGLKYWKKNIPMAVFIQICSFIAIICDLMLPLISEMFIDYVILDHSPTNDNIFSFMLSGKYGDIHSMKLFFSIAAVFMILLVIRIMFIYFRDLIQEWTGLQLEGELRDATYAKLMELEAGREEAQAILDDLYAQWEALADEE